LGGETARDNAAGLGPRDEARVRQNVEMLHDRRERHRERPGELAYGNVLVLVELREQSAPRGVGKRGEGAVERGILILNHVVKFRGDQRGCQPVQGQVVDRGCGPFYGPASLAGGLHLEVAALFFRLDGWLP
jgi:hypothetical protein